ncbi:phage tail protein [Paenibacillus polysaccharolyticus]|uniref:tail fiber protein n=1 Tax=Paenibacillus polysaccharolyticus TaxID=582692 RepID=UPI00203C686D|nr:tail fiber protein [Paenibacillus polysaccharolyticus]MCM3133768.1 phage tail protein [Paenibacillus polysaccharolyticus]
MPIETNRLKLPLPLGNENVSRIGINTIFEKIDEGVATQEDLEELRQLVSEIDVPDASLTQKGKVQLSNKTNGTSESEVPTEKALGEVMAATQSAQATINNRDGYGTTTNSGNLYSVTLSPAPTAYVDGLRITVKINATNTGAVTIIVNGLSAKSVLKSNGSAMTANALRINSIYSLIYNGTAFILQGEGGEYGTAVAGDVRSIKTIGTDAGLLAGMLITRDTSPTIIAPNGAAQKLNPGIYDYPITFSAGASYASGNSTISSSRMFPTTGFQDAYFYITVTGLGFRPNRVILRSFYGSGDFNYVSMGTYDYTTKNGAPTIGGTNSNYIILGAEVNEVPNRGFVRVQEFSGTTLPSTGFAMTENSFRLPVFSGSANVSWEAFKV